MDRQNTVITRWHERCFQRVSNTRRQERRVHIDDFHDDHRDEFEDEEDQTSLNVEAKFVPRGERRNRGF